VNGWIQFDRFTEEQKLVPVRQHRHTSDTEDETCHSNIPSTPTSNQKLDALKAAMYHGYDRATLKLLNYGLDLNTEIR
jgi:hypothetical protein